LIRKIRANNFLPMALISFALIAMSSAFTFAQNAQAVQKGPDTAEEHIKKAKQAYEAKNFDLVKDEAKRALKIEKNMPEANLLLALAYRNQGKLKDGFKYVNEAIKYRQGFGEAHYALALLHFDRNDRKQDDLKQAKAELDLAMTQGVRHSNALILKGILEVLTKRFEPALEAYKEALKVIKPTDPDLPRLQELVSALEIRAEFVSRKENVSYKRPFPLNSPFPRYTEEARKKRVQGTVNVMIVVTERGDVSSIFILSPLGYGLDQEAARAARQLKFSPATKDGKPVPYLQNIQIEFQLR
jgi:TonB family protein